MTHLSCSFLARVGLSALLLLGLLGAFGTRVALAQSPSPVAVKVHWTKDATVTPAVEECGAGGTLGGNATIHVRFSPPPDMFSDPWIKEIRMHENAGHTQDFVVSNPSPSFEGQPNAACGDPVPDYSGARYHHQHWPTTSGHNGPHTLTVTVEYITDPYLSQTQTVTSDPLTVDVQNLLITSTSPANPEPIPWDPDTMTSVALSATISAAYKANWPVTLRIFDSEQSLVKTYEQTLPVGGGATTVNFTWDGTQDAPLPNLATRGVYGFQWEVGNGYSYGDIDSDKASFLSVAETRSEVIAFDEATGQNTITDGCVLTDSGDPRANASEAHVRVYDDDCG